MNSITTNNEYEPKQHQKDAKINQALIILAERQEQFRTTNDNAIKKNIQAEIDSLQSDVEYLERIQEQTSIQEPSSIQEQSSKQSRVDQLVNVQSEARELFSKKNKDYGDAFASYGPIGVLVRIGDKIQRLQNIQNTGITLVQDEKLRDTLIDLHNYAAMAIMLLDEK